MSQDLTLTINADASGVKAAMTAAGASVQSFSSASKGAFDGIKGSIIALNSALSLAGQAMRGLSEVGGVVRGGLDWASNIEDLTSSFTTLLGSVDAAKGRLRELTDFAASTPFELPEVANASRTLQTLTKGALATGEGLRMVGDIAASTKQPFEEIATTVGRLYDGLQSGRPVGEVMMRLQELGAISGETRAKIETLQESGAKGSQVWALAQQAFSRFAGEMERRSTTFSGLASTLRDNFGQALGTAMQPALEALKGVIRTLSETITSPQIQAALDRLGQMFASGLSRLPTLFQGAIAGARGFATGISPAMDQVGSSFDGMRSSLSQLISGLSGSNSIEQTGRKIGEAFGTAAIAVKNFSGVVVAAALATLPSQLAGLSAAAAGVATAIRGMTAAGMAFIVTPFGAVVAGLSAVAVGIAAITTGIEANTAKERGHGEAIDASIQKSRMLEASVVDRASKAAAIKAMEEEIAAVKQRAATADEEQQRLYPTTIQYLESQLRKITLKETAEQSAAESVAATTQEYVRQAESVEAVSDVFETQNTAASETAKYAHDQTLALQEQVKQSRLIQEMEKLRSEAMSGTKSHADKVAEAIERQAYAADTLKAALEATSTAITGIAEAQAKAIEQSNQTIESYTQQVRWVGQVRQSIEAVVQIQGRATQEVNLTTQAIESLTSGAARNADTMRQVLGILNQIVAAAQSARAQGVALS